ncbi:MAG: hypothetical protein OEU50_10825 [Gammaproteobacteria bacterium]|nr:hypothetical protein [Gammaproteobacteria bacterium]
MRRSSPVNQGIAAGVRASSALPGGIAGCASRSSSLSVAGDSSELEILPMVVLEGYRGDYLY